MRPSTISKAGPLRWLAVTAIASAALLASPPAAQVQGYPTQPVKVIVQQGAGGSIDVIARIMAEHISPAIGQQMVVINQPGAGGLVAARALAASPPDGYTLFLAASSVFVSLSEINKNLNFNIDDFVPIGFVGEQPFIIATSDKLGAKSLADVVALSKQRPEGLNFSAGTRGGLQHMTAEWFRARTGANLTMVHYPSTAAALSDVLSGRVPVIVDTLSGLGGAATGAGMTMLGVAAQQPLTRHPQVPTIAGILPDFNASGWFVLVGPRGTPPAVVEKISEGLRKALADPALQKKFADLSNEVRSMSPAELAVFIKAEQEKWRPIVRQVAPQQ